ncbi:MAG TPA: AAA family ATPase [Chthoniobacterales bacterium]
MMTTLPPPDTTDLAPLQTLPETYQRLATAIRQRIIGQDALIRDIFVALLSRGHCLMVGVPGLAKTLLVKTLGEIFDLSFHRIQFTPDLMPSDITGSEIIEQSSDGRREFRFVPGPLFTQLLLADEINRTPPKTQAALLEAMQERQVTVAGKTYPLGAPFFVLATQNPIEQEGTYPLPEAQLDRFMFCLHVGYPSLTEEIDILQRTTTNEEAAVPSVLAESEILSLQSAVRQIVVPHSVAEFAVRIVHASRPGNPLAPEAVKKYVRWGAGPRASQYLALAGKALAAMDGRFNVAVEDIVAAVPMVLRHRVLTNFRAEADGVEIEGILNLLVPR